MRPSDFILLGGVYALLVVGDIDFGVGGWFFIG
jgi:hypothetical protein